MKTGDMQQSELETIPAEELLRLWEQVNQRRSAEIEIRSNNWMLPSIGIEEAIQITRRDVNGLFWFLDKTLKLLAQKPPERAGDPKNP